MRSEDGKHLEDVIGVTDHDCIDGIEFAPNVLDFEQPIAVGNMIKMASGEVFLYHGEDSIGRSIFTRAGHPITDVLFRR